MFFLLSFYYQNVNTNWDLDMELVGKGKKVPWLDWIGGQLACLQLCPAETLQYLVEKHYKSIKKVSLCLIPFAVLTLPQRPQQAWREGERTAALMGQNWVIPAPVSGKPYL